LPTGLYYADQSPEIEELIPHITGVKDPILVMGDFNMTDQNPGYQLLTQVVRDAYREAGWGFGFTFPNPHRADRPLSLGPVSVPAPLVRIDYIFHSAQLLSEQAHAICQGGSDHCYVVAQLSYPGP
jgi:endonuclease/exonuclease/phosphatase family metal-dependent hydrolase